MTFDDGVAILVIVIMCGFAALAGSVLAAGLVVVAAIIFPLEWITRPPRRGKKQ